jgi:hypothetical protein
MSDPLELQITQSPAAYAFVGVALDRNRNAVSLQLVRIGFDTEVPNEGQEFYWLSAEEARTLQTELGRAIAALEPTPASEGATALEAEVSTDAGRASTSTDAEPPARSRSRRSRNAD